MTNKYREYLKVLSGTFKKLSMLEFLQPDNSVAFSVGSRLKNGYKTKYETRALLQGGNLNVSLNNGTRRTATVDLSNLDDAFGYSVNNIWFGNRVRLSMGVVLPDGTDFYLPQGVFYIKDPTTKENPNSHTITYNLVDKWSYLDGSLFGTIPDPIMITEGEDAFSFVSGCLSRDKKSMMSTAINKDEWIDNETPVFTNYYDGFPDISYEILNPDGSKTTVRIPRTSIAYTNSFPSGSPISEPILEALGGLIVWVGYDPTGAFRIEPAQTDVLDSEKPILYAFSTKNSTFLGKTETAKASEVFNDVIINAKGLRTGVAWGRATNEDPSSDTNRYLIGIKNHTEDRSDLVTAQQCVDFAKLTLKKKTILQKSITISCSQMFHLQENGLVSIQRPDKPNHPEEKHLIQSFSIPIGETGEMTINATSVNDLQSLYTVTSSSEEQAT